MHYNPNYTTKIPTYRWLPYRNFGPAPAPAYLDAVVEPVADAVFKCCQMFFYFAAAWLASPQLPRSCLACTVPPQLQ